MIMIFNHSNFVVRILHSEHPEPQDFCVSSLSFEPAPAVRFVVEGDKGL